MENLHRAIIHMFDDYIQPCACGYVAYVPLVVNGADYIDYSPFDMMDTPQEPPPEEEEPIEIDMEALKRMMWDMIDVNISQPKECYPRKMFDDTLTYVLAQLAAENKWVKTKTGDVRVPSVYRI